MLVPIGLFPVYAGLFQSSALALHNPLAFSSRMRGCSRSRKLESFFLTFPRSRGVVPCPVVRAGEWVIFPRVCGVDP